MARAPWWWTELRALYRPNTVGQIVLNQHRFRNATSLSNAILEATDGELGCALGRLGLGSAFTALRLMIDLGQFVQIGDHSPPTPIEEDRRRNSRARNCATKMLGSIEFALKRQRAFRRLGGRVR